MASLSEILTIYLGPESGLKKKYNLINLLKYFYYFLKILIQFFYED